MDRICNISKIEEKSQKRKKKGLQKEEKFDIITNVAEKTASKQKASEKSLKKLKKGVDKSKKLLYNSSCTVEMSASGNQSKMSKTVRRTLKIKQRRKERNP